MGPEADIQLREERSDTVGKTGGFNRASPSLGEGGGFMTVVCTARCRKPRGPEWHVAFPPCVGGYTHMEDYRWAEVRTWFNWWGLQVSRPSDQ